MRKARILGGVALAMGLLCASGATGQDTFPITYEPQECPAGYVQEVVWQCQSNGSCVLIGYTCGVG